MTKQVVTTKFKVIRIKHRKAVDSGCKSGHGQVVFLCFDLCESIRGGLPSTEQIPSGLESIELESDVMPLISSTGTISASSSLNTSVEDDDELTSKDGVKLETAPAKSEEKCLECNLLITRKKS